MPPMLIADHPALDLLNSRASPDGTEHEWIGDGVALTAWLTAAGFEVLPIGGRPALDGVAARVRGLREWWRTFVASRAGAQLNRGSLDQLAPLNDLLAECAGYRRVGWSTGALAWTGLQRGDTGRAVLGALADAAGDLVCNADFTRVRQCEGAGCTLWFLDRTKAGGRRWCSMAVCGNRAKAAAHRARQRASLLRP